MANVIPKNLWESYIRTPTRTGTVDSGDGLFNYQFASTRGLENFSDKAQYYYTHPKGGGSNLFNMLYDSNNNTPDEQVKLLDNAQKLVMLAKNHYNLDVRVMPSTVRTKNDQAGIFKFGRVFNEEKRNRDLLENIHKPEIAYWERELTDYELKLGDTLSKIGKRKGIRLKEMRQFNQQTKGRENDLQVGEKIKIPSQVHTYKSGEPGSESMHQTNKALDFNFFPNYIEKANTEEKKQMFRNVYKLAQEHLGAKRHGESWGDWQHIEF